MKIRNDLTKVTKKQTHLYTKFNISEQVLNEDESSKKLLTLFDLLMTIDNKNKKGSQ